MKVFKETKDTDATEHGSAVNSSNINNEAVVPVANSGQNNGRNKKFVLLFVVVAIVLAGATYSVTVKKAADKKKLDTTEGPSVTAVEVKDEPKVTIVEQVSRDLKAGKMTYEEANAKLETVVATVTGQEKDDIWLIIIGNCASSNDLGCLLDLEPRVSYSERIVYSLNIRIAGVYADNGDNPKAVEYYQKAIEQGKKLGVREENLAVIKQSLEDLKR